jgi:hypothetical protein
LNHSSCYESGGAEQLIAKVDFYKSYKTLAEFQQATNQDLNSRENCGQLPQKIDVQELHAETTAYVESALKILTARGEQEKTPTQ